MSQVPSFRVQNGVAGDAEQLALVLDRQATAPGVQRLRAWAREALRPLPGERVVDVGSGTGDELQALGTLVGPSGSAVGVEPNPGLRAEASRRAGESGSAARFVAGDAYALPFDESTVDVMRCERVFQHLDHPERAAAEIARVLRPGGRVALIDSDWGTAIMHPGDPAVIDAMARFLLDRYPNPYSGRRLAGQLSAAGLEITDRGSQALIQTPESFDAMMRTMTTLAVTAGAISEAQRDQLHADLEDGASRGDFHFSATMFGVLATKEG